MVRATPFVAAWRALGRVIGKKADETAHVSVTKVWFHPKFRDDVVSSKKYRIHDPENVARIGDLVQIEAIPPIKDAKGNPLTFEYKKHVEHRKVAYDKNGNMHVQSASLSDPSKLK